MRGGATDLDWLVVGGGIHGVHLAVRLIGEAGVALDRIRIVDPAESLLARWRECTATTGMEHLRSPSVHHLGPRPGDLAALAGRNRRLDPSLFAPPYDRPALRLFNQHCDLIIHEFGLSNLHVRDTVRSCEVDGDRVHVRTEDGTEYTARQILLAIGSGRPYRPAWARVRDDRTKDRLWHVFDPGFHEHVVYPGESVAVIGGGVSAAQVALRLCRAGQQVTLVSRHRLREHQFDSDPGWLGPKLMARFQFEEDFDQRRQIIDEARFRGSVPPEVNRDLRRCIHRHQIDWYEDEVENAIVCEDGIGLELAGGDRFDVDRVCLATGFDRTRPGGAMVDELIASASLPCAACGYPIIDSHLRWHPRIYVSGSLAELELGPTSRNIAGARRAGERILASIHANATGRSAPILTSLTPQNG